MTAEEELVDPDPTASPASTHRTVRPDRANSKLMEAPITPAPITIASYMLARLAASAEVVGRPITSLTPHTFAGGIKEGTLEFCGGTPDAEHFDLELAVGCFQFGRDIPQGH